MVHKFHIGIDVSLKKFDARLFYKLLHFYCKSSCKGAKWFCR